MSLKADMAKYVAKIRKTDRKMAHLLEHPKRGGKDLLQETFTKKVRVKDWDQDGFRCVTINGSYAQNKHILMIPGGAYTLEPSARYRQIAEYFAQNGGFRVTIVLCPLSPEYTASTVHQYLNQVYWKLIFDYPTDEMFLFGDFSGGGLALSFLQELRRQKELPLPVKTAVVSPWLDLSLKNPKIKIAKKTDFVLPVEALREVGNRYRGSIDVEDPLVSPFYGDFNDLGSILIFSGTEDSMTPDCELLAEKAEGLTGTELIYKKGAGMIHDWILIPCRESDATLDLISIYFQKEWIEF
ncbi:alpha/beta hydrolase [Clostridium sp. E02]|uniref:alpha/beta hydrolase fold domain-containing protein n=1 Tax=Clostridium sp. E02 TaxID=2487134 RepID=UPI000F5488F3|nr:alpha/beta hydrolase [Clostridium sp. E02]